MFPHRAYMLDVGRGKVPTTATLRRLVEILARFNYNQLQIRLVPTPQGSVPLSADELRALDAFCSVNGLDLVPNIDVFGATLRADWSCVAKIYDELLPSFGADYVNIGGGGETDDEEADVAAYVARLNQACAAVRARGKRPMIWGDVVLRHSAVLDALPKDVHVLVGGYEGNHPFLPETVKLRTAGFDFYVCPGTSAWNALAGRVENVRENMQAAEVAARRFNAKGFLVADWGGEGHWQPLAASLPGLVLGGVFAYDAVKAPKMDLEGALDAVMGVPLGGVLLRLGTLYLRGGALRPGETELFRILSHDRGYSRPMQFTDSVLAEISAVAEGCRHAAAQYASGTLWGEGAVWAQEIMYMANLVDAACNRRDEKRLRFLREDHAQVWRLRNREEGLAASQALLPRF